MNNNSNKDGNIAYKEVVDRIKCNKSQEKYKKFKQNNKVIFKGKSTEIDNKEESKFENNIKKNNTEAHSVE